MTDGPAIGETFAGRYRILAELGTGAMGTVYLAEHLVMKRRTAIKVLRGPIARDPEAVARFTRGARNASRVQHPHVCAVYDFGDSEEGLQFLAMEYVDGESLADAVAREGTIDVATTIEIGVQTCAALQAAHDMGIVHRDLKPGNIMLAVRPSGGWHAKVVDFDIAKGEEREGELTRLGFVIGTPEYMSPEQLIGESLDGRSDLYALGIILYRMLTASFPFSGETSQDLLLNRLTEAPLPLVQLAPDRPFPEGLQGVLDRALARDRSDRWSSASAMGGALTSVAPGVAAASGPSGSAPIAEDEATVFVPETKVVPTGRSATEGRSWRSSWALPTLSAVVTVALFGVGWAIFQGGVATSPAGGDPVDSVFPGLERGDPLPDSGNGRIVLDPDTNDELTSVDTGHVPVPVDPAGASALSDMAARDLLDRLMRRMEMPDLARGTLTSAGDSAETVFATSTLPDEVRARGAYARASVELLLGRAEEAGVWVRRAIGLDPDNPAYKQFLNLIGAQP